MQNLKPALILAALPAFLVTHTAHARQCVTLPIFDSSGGAFTTEDISGGAVTSGASGTRSFNMIKLSVDLTDADNGVSKLDFTFQESDSTTGTFRKVPHCSLSGTTWTCGEKSIEWDPSTHGKNFTISFPWMYEALKFTVTPTGHGASDTVTVTARGCW